MVSRDSEKGERIYNRPVKSFVPSYFFNSKARRWTSWLVPMIIVANIIMFTITMYVNDCPRNNVAGNCVAKFLGRFSFQPLKTNFLLGPTDLTMTKMGDINWNKVVNEYQWWRVFTCLWIQYGVFHLLSNMLTLICFGIRLEQQFGALRIGAIYLLSGLSGSILSLLFLQKSYSVGASDAVFGLFGALLLVPPLNKSVTSKNQVFALLMILIISIVQMAFGILPYNIDSLWVGFPLTSLFVVRGVLVGFLLGSVFLLSPQFGLPTVAATITRPKATVCELVTLLICLLLQIPGIVVGIVVLSKKS